MYPEPVCLTCKWIVQSCSDSEPRCFDFKDTDKIMAYMVFKNYLQNKHKHNYKETETIINRYSILMKSIRDWKKLLVLNTKINADFTAIFLT